MGFFEALLNLDCELTALGTKAFVAKENVVNSVFYSSPKKKSKSSDEKKKEETENKTEEKKAVTEEDIHKSLDEFKQKMEESLKIAVENGEDLSAINAEIQESTKEMSAEMQKYLSSKKDVVEKEETPEVAPATEQVDPNQPVLTAGPDFSQFQQGVTYDQQPQQPAVPRPDEPNGKPVTPEAADTAIGKKTAVTKK